MRTGAHERERRLAALTVLAAVFAACSSAGGSASAPSGTLSSPAPAEVTQGDFQVQFELTNTTWRSDEPLTGEATLRYLGQGSTTIAHAASLFGFEVAEVGGNRRIEPIWAESCVPETISRATPITSGLDKSGGIDTPFAEQFLATPTFRLPPGTWDITAIAQFDVAGCGVSSPGQSFRLEATVRVQVVAAA